MGDFVDQPGLCNCLHPGSGERNELAAKKKLEIAVPQCAQGRG